MINHVSTSSVGCSPERMWFLKVSHVLLASSLLLPFAGSAQAHPAAVRATPLSVFGGVSGVYTGLSGGRNLSLSAGADLGITSFGSYEVAVEVRGLYPLKDGAVDAQKNLLGGLRVAHPIGNHLLPYVDILAGAGQVSYVQPYVNQAGTFAYLHSSSDVYSAGVGTEVKISPAWGLLADAQFQRYSVPVGSSAHIVSKPLTIGVVYHLFSGLR